MVVLILLHTVRFNNDLHQNLTTCSKEEKNDCLMYGMINQVTRVYGFCNNSIKNKYFKDLIKQMKCGSGQREGRGCQAMEEGRRGLAGSSWHTHPSSAAQRFPPLPAAAAPPNSATSHPHTLTHSACTLIDMALLQAPLCAAVRSGDRRRNDTGNRRAMTTKAELQGAAL